MLDLTGFIICGRSCVNAKKSYSTTYIYPNVSGTMLIPKSSFVLRRERDKATSSSVEFIPEFSREHYYLSVPGVVVLKPSMPRSCSEVAIAVDLRNKSASPFRTVVVMAVVIGNRGKVSSQIRTVWVCRLVEVIIRTKNNISMSTWRTKTQTQS